MSNTIEKIKALNLSDDAEVTLSYEEGADVFVHNESEVETALENTDVVETFSSLVTTPGINAKTQYDQDPLETLRDEGLLEDYERGSGDFVSYVAEAIRENFYDVDLIEYSTEKYDYKRGFCTLSAEVKVKASDLFSSGADIEQWTASVRTDTGTLTIN